MPIPLPTINLIDISPEMTLGVFGLVILLLDLFLRREGKGYLAVLSLIGVGGAFYASLRLWGSSHYSLSQSIVVDNLSLFFNAIFLLGTAMVILMSVSYIRREGINLGEYYSLLLFSTLGMLIISSGNDLIILFLGLELVSIPLYILSGFARTNLKSNEAALKYLLLGVFATAFLLYGIALIYGSTGTIKLPLIAKMLADTAISSNPLLFIGMGLLIIGFGFKVALVPFHMWTPDVYEGAPTSVTAFMSVGVKAAGFAALLRILLTALDKLQFSWVSILVVLAILTMTVGNVIALAQTNIKRMLAYSSIAHAGYILVGLVAGSRLGVSSILFYLVVYALMNLGAFAVVILVGRKGDQSLHINDYAGLGYRYPLMGAAMSVFLLSLAGIPPTAGFVGKFYIFSAAVKEGFIKLAIIGVLNSALSLFYYLRVMVIMYMREPEKKEVSPIHFSPGLVIALLIAVLGILYLGILPSRVIDLAADAIGTFISG